MRILLLLFFISSFNLAQTNEDVLKLHKHYEAFEYNILISKAENLLLFNDNLSSTDLSEIFVLKAASHFAVKDENSARKSFIELLKVNSEYELDDVIFSPKLVNFFKEVKKEFLDILTTEQKIENPSEHEVNKFAPESYLTDSNYNNVLAKSLLLPGWGHLDLGENVKGVILTSASTFVLGSMIYFIIDANKKEKEYLAETNNVVIQNKYDKYNQSYKIRNLLIASYAAIWLYSQIDILFFSNQLGSKNISINDFSLKYSDGFLISINLPF